MEKINYNLLTAGTTSPISLSSTSAIELFTGPIIDNTKGSQGVMYMSARAFTTEGGNDLTFKLYESWMGGTTGDWFLHTAFAAVSTAFHQSVPLTGLGNYLRLGYISESTTVSFVRVNITLETNHDIDSLGHY